jgi:nitroreductase
MSSNVFRSQFMQQFAAAARAQNHRPSPISEIARRTSTHPFHTSTKSQKQNNVKSQNIEAQVQNTTIKDHISTSPIQSRSYHCTPCNDESPPTQKPSSTRSPAEQQLCRSFSTKMTMEEGEEDEIQSKSQSFQSIIKTRRTTSNFVPLANITLSQQQHIQDAISRAVECAVQAPNHHRTEPTTYYRIKPQTQSWENLMDIVYNVTLTRNKNKSNKTEEEGRISAESKRNKWRDRVGGYIVVCVSGQPDQQQKSSTQDVYDPLPICPPETERQMEDYACACASIQNILLALHSEGLGAKVSNFYFCFVNFYVENAQCHIHGTIYATVLNGFCSGLLDPSLVARQ